LEKEYEMQKSWREDGDKLTFIACLPYEGAFEADENENVVLKGGQPEVDRPSKMIGDVNLFLVEADNDDDEEEDKTETKSCIGEIEIMVARTDMQGKGIGTSILLTFLWYILTHLDFIVLEYASSLGKRVEVMKYLRVKIDAGNVRSIRLFEKVGFEKVSEKANYFGELELRYAILRKSREDVAMVLGVEAPKIAVYQQNSDQPLEI
jgi:RimJ/RimL family protein N-acetyltransferase